MPTTRTPYPDGTLIQPKGHPEFAGRILSHDTDHYTVRGAFARPDQIAWQFAIPIDQAELYYQPFGYPQPIN